MHIHKGDILETEVGVKLYDFVISLEDLEVPDADPAAVVRCLPYLNGGSELTEDTPVAEMPVRQITGKHESEATPQDLEIIEKILTQLPSSS